MFAQILLRAAGGLCTCTCTCLHKHNTQVSRTQNTRSQPSLQNRASAPHGHGIPHGNIPPIEKFAQYAALCSVVSGNYIFPILRGQGCHDRKSVIAHSEPEKRHFAYSEPEKRHFATQNRKSVILPTQNRKSVITVRHAAVQLTKTENTQFRMNKLVTSFVPPCDG
jgi:hypothetical protein